VSEPALKLTTYFGEGHRGPHGLVADALLDLYGRAGVRTSVLLRGTEGFGAAQRLRTDRLLTLSEDLPLVSVAIDAPERIMALLGDVLALHRRGLVTLERARAVGDRTGVLEDGTEETKLTVYLGRHERSGGQPAFATVCSLLHRHGVDGASVLLGVDGTVAGERRRARFFGTNRGVPLMVIAVGRRERLAEALPELAGLAPGALMTVERVRVLRRDGVTLAPVPDIGGQDPSGLPMWQKLMVYSSEHALHGGSPIHVAIVRGLRGAGAPGATSLRGLWGFHGATPPHGDRLLQLRRHVPVVTIAVERPDRIARALAVIEAATAEAGVVTAELVPAAVEVDDGPVHLHLADPGAPPS
jgi:PII-like signaling protein